VAALDQRPCKLDKLPGPCCDQHVRPELERVRGKTTSFHCPIYHEHETFGIKPGDKGARIVWGCIEGGPRHGTGTCTRGLLRRALLDLGIDKTCLGGLGKYDPDFTGDIAPSAWRPRQQLVDPLIITKAQKYDALDEIPFAIQGRLRDMCERAIRECESGHVTADPWELLPAESKPFYALAGRSGIPGNYKYRLFAEWCSISDGCLKAV
jgi:hypothetical protein